MISADEHTNIDGVYDYDQTSPARCGSCCYRDDLAAFTAIPTDLSTPGPLVFDWQNSEGEPAGSASWERVPADQLNETLQRMKQYWPGIMVTVEGGPDGVTMSTDPLWAPSVPALADQVAATLVDALGEPDTVTGLGGTRNAVPHSIDAAAQCGGNGTLSGAVRHRLRRLGKHHP